MSYPDKIMSQNPVPKFRARVVDLLIQATEARQEIRRYKEDKRSLEDEEALKKLNRAKIVFDTALRELATLREIQKKEISEFYAPADYGLLESYSQSLITWTQEFRSWILRAQKDGALSQCVSRGKTRSEDESRVKRADNITSTTHKEISNILLRLVTAEKAIQNRAERLKNFKKTVLGDFRISTEDESSQLSNANALNLHKESSGPDTTVLEEASKALTRADDQYKACRWHFFQVESEVSHVLDVGQRPDLAPVHPAWNDMMDRAIKKIFLEDREEITNIITQGPSRQIATSACEDIRSQMLGALEYPLQAIHVFTECAQTLQMEEEQVEAELFVSLQDGPASSDDEKRSSHDDG